MNTNYLSRKIFINCNSFYKNEIFRPFIDAYLLNENMYKYNLFNVYIFGKQNIITNNLKYSSYSGEMFIGLNLFEKELVPLFLQVLIDNDSLEITGFSNLFKTDQEKEYFKNYCILKDLSKFNLDVTIYNSYSRDIPSLEENLSNFSKRVKTFLK